jgi:hypothetical protein
MNYKYLFSTEIEFDPMKVANHILDKVKTEPNFRFSVGDKNLIYMLEEVINRAARERNVSVYHIKCAIRAIQPANNVIEFEL